MANEPEDVKDQMSFSVYFSRTSDTLFKTSSLFLLLTTEPVTDPAANITKAITEKFSPGQEVVLTADNPVHTIRKQLQWMFPDECSDSVWMLEILHIEQNLRKTIGDWLKGSG